MTTERTPQDVLRELRAASEIILGITASMFRRDQAHGQVPRRCAEHVDDAIIEGWARRLNDARRRLDKAIAEAPDSPPEWPTREEVRQARLDLKEGRAKPLRVPDAPSEKPGLDVERLRLAMEAAWPSHTEGSGGTGRSIQASWRVTDPALPSTYLANRVSREYDRLGSTDSEGR